MTLDHSPKGHQTFQYKPLKSSGSDKSLRSTKRSNDSINKLNNTYSGISDKSKNIVRSPKVPQVRSKSVIIGPGGPQCSPDLSIRRIYAVRSLNDIVFSEEDYDFAAVWRIVFFAAECFLKFDAFLKLVFYLFATRTWILLIVFVCRA